MTRGSPEIELKLQLRRGSRKLIEAAQPFAAVAPAHLDQRTTYFDTPDGSLFRAGLSLRVRRSGIGRIQTVKALACRPGVSSNRLEWEWPVHEDGPDLDQLARASALRRVVPKIRGRLQPLFVTQIRRTVRLLHLTGGTIVEASIDLGTIQADATREAISELELELKAGPIEPMYRLAAEIQSAARLWISSESKFARGLRLATGRDERPQSAQAISLNSHGSAARGFYEIIGTALGHLIANIPQTLQGSAEGLHQMRVALRETRAALQLFEPILDSTVAIPFDTKLQRFGHLFGKARDWDVFCLEMLAAARRELSRSELRA